MKPQSETVLRHLVKHGHISPAEAFVVYGYPRLAANIHDIRNAGYEVNTVMSKDDQGHNYARYELAA
jgi:hypothetical protein